MAIALAALALRAGLALRRARHAGARRGRALFERHYRFAKPAVVLGVTGFALGPLSMWALRGRAPFETVHAIVGVVAAGLFAATGLLGRRLERGTDRPIEAHARLGVALILASAAAAVMGFVLLP
ncbi:MAG: DUF4079 family protein [Deltaproteobacteria bacterium]|nr:MAG: DUF4079 family protein [Deltaproteobacteria bacterium]